MSSSSLFDSSLVVIKGRRRKPILKERPPVTSTSSKSDKKAATRVKIATECETLKATMMSQELPGNILYAGETPVVIEWTQNQEEVIAEANNRIIFLAAKLYTAIDKMRRAGLPVDDMLDGLNPEHWIGPNDDGGLEAQVRKDSENFVQWQVPDSAIEPGQPSLVQRDAPTRPGDNQASQSSENGGPVRNKRNTKAKKPYEVMKKKDRDEARASSSSTTLEDLDEQRGTRRRQRREKENATDPIASSESGHPYPRMGYLQAMEAGGSNVSGESRTDGLGSTSMVEGSEGQFDTASARLPDSYFSSGGNPLNLLDTTSQNLRVDGITYDFDGSRTVDPSPFTLDNELFPSSTLPPSSSSMSLSSAEQPVSALYYDSGPSPVGYTHNLITPNGLGDSSYSNEFADSPNQVHSYQGYGQNYDWYQDAENGEGGSILDTYLF